VMMRSLSTSALGQPSETKLTLGAAVIPIWPCTMGQARSAVTHQVDGFRSRSTHPTLSTP
jgi:hypothetical protein